METIKNPEFDWREYGKLVLRTLDSMQKQIDQNNELIKTIQGKESEIGSLLNQVKTANEEIGRLRNNYEIITKNCIEHKIEMVKEGKVDAVSHAVDITTLKAELKSALTTRATLITLVGTVIAILGAYLMTLIKKG